MFTNESALDKKNRKWFQKQHQHQSLVAIELKEGSLRALTPFKIEFEYPIALIAGTNGCGKSTLLAIAACGFHSDGDNLTVTQSNLPYYTFKDFLVQSKQEIPPSGIEIAYTTTVEQQPDGEVASYLAVHALRKAKDGKWSTYAKRPKKNVEYFGIERVVPHYEKSTSKSYRKAFASEGARSQNEERTEKSVGKVLGKVYKDFQFQKHSKYKLPQVSKEGHTYSGFNMGAGENALFDLFFTLHSCPNNSLIVIDEIELGLHASAQVKFIEELKVICEDKKLQVIATTHSPNALSCVPPYARYYIESGSAGTHIHRHVSEALATGKLTGNNSEELIVFVEDGVAERIISHALSPANKQRVVVKPIGSNIIVARVLASFIKNDKKKNYLAYVDGDTVAKKADLLREIQAIYEQEDKKFVENFYEKNIFFIGDKQAPERWLISGVLESSLAEFANDFELASESEAELLLKQALNQPAHSELHFIAKSLQIDTTDLLNRTARLYFRKATAMRQVINSTFEAKLA
jgi:predicted ATPase